MLKRTRFHILIGCQSCHHQYRAEVRYIPGTRTVDWNALTGDVVRCPNCHENDGQFQGLEDEREPCGLATWLRLRWQGLRGQRETEVQL
jgi:hypothetical protein